MYRGLPLFLCLVAHFVSYAQGVQHTIDVHPICLYRGFYNQTPFGTHGLNYQLNFKRHALQAEVDGVLFAALYPKLDDTAAIKNGRKYLDVSASYKFAVLDLENVQKRHRLNVVLGYGYVQHQNWLNTDYWYTKQREDESYDILQSRNIHLAKLGLEWNYVKSPKDEKMGLKSTSSFILRAEYFYGFSYQLTGINGNQFYVNNFPSTKITLPKIYDFNPHGGRVSFQYRYYLLSYLSIVSEVAVMFYPNIQYEPNRDIFVPRGGEYYFPLYSAMKFGIGFHLIKKSP